jgi:dCTP diphosphatase
MTHRPKPSDQDGLLQLRDALREFAAERDWDQFHTPKNLAIALSVEAAELLEHFQWIGDNDPEQFTPRKLDEISLEAADVLLYLVRLADKLNIDLVQAAMRKFAQNAEKYPIDKARGTNTKYTEL